MGGDQCLGDEAEDKERDSTHRVQDQTGSSEYALEKMLNSCHKKSVSCMYEFNLDLIFINHKYGFYIKTVN